VSAFGLFFWTRGQSRKRKIIDGLSQFLSQIFMKVLLDWLHFCHHKMSQGSEKVCLNGSRSKKKRRMMSRQELRQKPPLLLVLFAHTATRFKANAITIG